MGITQTETVASTDDSRKAHDERRVRFGFNRATTDEGDVYVRMLMTLTGIPILQAYIVPVPTNSGPLGYS